MSIEKFKMPVGRIVGGNVTLWEDAVDYHTKQKKLNADGTPRKEHRVSIAYPKQEFLDKVWPYVLQEVGKIYPQYANVHPDQCEMSNFAWKVINGDSPNYPQGSQVPYNVRDGYAGCYVVKFSTSAFLPSTFKYENGAWREIDPKEVKCGDYVIANVTITAHNEKAGGLYWNPNGYELLYYGKEIKSSNGGNPTDMFGGDRNYQMPAGASLTPISSAPVNAQMPMQGAQPAPMSAPMPMPTAIPAAQPATMPAPAYDFVNNAQGIQPMPAPAAMPAQMPMGMPQAAPAPMAQPAQSAPQQGQPFNSLIQDRIPY